MNHRLDFLLHFNDIICMVCCPCFYYYYYSNPLYTYIPIYIYIIFLHYYYHMNKQMDTNSKPHLCPHIGKLTKKALQSLLTYNYTPSCSCCKAELKNKEVKISIEDIRVDVCLHCGVLFCGKSQCINMHQVESHLFWGKIRIKGDNLPSLLQSVQKQTTQQQNISEIVCRSCGSIDQLLTQAKNNKLDNGQEYNKLVRFNQFVQNTVKILTEVIAVKFSEFQQLNGEIDGDVFGLRNLGNTCFFNSVLQVLYHTSQLSQIYIDFMKKSTFSSLISQQKQRRKNMEYYYDDVIQKQQANKWHVVAAKKIKTKQGTTKGHSLQKFVAHGLVRDNKINCVYGGLIKNITEALTIQQNSEKDKVIFQPVQLLRKLADYDQKYDHKQQQDAQQLLIFLIDLLSQGEMLTIVGSTGDRKQRYDKIENLLGRQKLTPVQQIFGSYLASRIVCLGCDKESWVTDFTYHLPVSLQQVKYQQKSIQADANVPILGIKYYRELYYPAAPSNHCKVFGSLFKAERLTNAQNYYNCESCSGLAAIKQFYMLEPPEILVISFKRFENNKKGKITTFIAFDEEISTQSVSLKVKLQQDQQPPCYKYELYAVIVHKGETISSGHYICYVKIQSQNQQKIVWYQFSDQKYKKVTSKQVLRQQAYIIFYRKVKK